MTQLQRYNPEHGCEILYDKNDYFKVYRSPTGNCQLSCISNADVILDKSRRSVLAKFRTIARCNNKNIILLDINHNNGYVNKIKSIFGKKYIISESPYRSTNGSNMIIYLIDIRDLNRKVRNKYIMQ